MKNILNYLAFINESVITLSPSVIGNLKKIYNLVDNESKDWIFKILIKSGQDINLIPTNNYNYNVYKSNSIGYYNLEIDKGDRKTTQLFKIGKTLKMLVPDIPNHTLSKISASLQSLVSLTINIVEGKEIADYYKHDIVDSGTLGRSCMNDRPRSYFELYTKNSNVKLAVLLDDYNKLVARALLWNTDKGWFMDRVYYSSDSYKFSFIDWAIENKYLIDTEQIYTINLENSEFDEYPYLDTHRYLCINKKVISNTDIFEQTDQVIRLVDTDGRFDVIRNHKLPLRRIYSLNIFNYISYLGDFINLSINFHKWYDDYIEDEVSNYSDANEFIDEYDSFILHNFENINFIDQDLTKDNIIDKIKYYNQSNLEKYQSIIEAILRHKYSEEMGYNSWKDITDGSHIEYDIYTKDWIKRLIDKYCSASILNNNLEKLYEEDYDEYNIITYDWFN